MVRVVWSNGPADALPEAIMISGAKATSSSANLRLLSTSPPAQRISIRMLRPSDQPNWFNCPMNVLTSVGYSESSAVAGSNTPIRRIRSGCCANPANGHAAAPQSVMMNSRRLIASSEAKGQGVNTGRLAHLSWLGRVQGHVEWPVQCPLWVKSGHLQCTSACPLYPRKRHQMRHMGMSAKDQ